MNFDETRRSVINIHWPAGEGVRHVGDGIYTEVFKSTYEQIDTQVKAMLYWSMRDSVLRRLVG